MQPAAENRAIHIRVAMPAEAGGIARVHSECWRDAYAGLLPDGHLIRLSPEALAIRWGRHLVSAGQSSTTLVAMAVRDGNEEEVAGFAEYGLGGRREQRPAGDGEIFMLYVATDWRDLGIGRQLATAAFDRLAARGCTVATIWCLRENHAAAGFYRRLGGTQLRETRIERVAGTDYPVIGFRWPLGGADSEDAAP
jgi:ribosomal protein S18 acetylase RimI-like enzyme